MSMGVADVVELNLDEETSHDEDEVVHVHDSGGATGEGASNGAGAESGISRVMGILPPAPVAPANSLKINNITYPPLLPAIQDMGVALQDRVKNISKIKYRLEKIDTTVVKINNSLSQGFDPTGAVVSTFMNQASKTLEELENYMAKLEDNNTTIATSADLIESTPASTDFDPNLYQADIDFVRATSEYKWNAEQSKMLQRMMAIDNAKSVQNSTKQRWEKSNNSSRSASPSHSFVMRSNADSLKPPILSYQSATLLNIKDHLRRCDDWIKN